MINHELDRGQQVKTQFSNFSTFHLPKVTRKDSGNYTCAPHNLRPASVFIHIIDEDSNSAAAAIHTGGDEENGAVVASKAATITFGDIKEKIKCVVKYFIIVSIIIQSVSCLNI